MAVAVIGGLITSTLLSLLVIPAVFTLVDDLEQMVPPPRPAPAGAAASRDMNLAVRQVSMELAPDSPGLRPFALRGAIR